MAGITAERLAMFAERAMAPRLLEVDRTKAAVEDATDAKAVSETEFQAAQEAVKGAAKVYADALDRSKSASIDLTKLPPKTCFKGRCQPDGRERVLKANVSAASAAVVVAQKALAGATVRLATLNPSRASQNLRSANLAHREAVATSQMHGFAAHAVFGTSPTKVTDEQLGWVLRICIFLPALVVSLAASFVAGLGATPYQKPETVKAPDDDTIEVSDEILLEIGRALSEAAKPLHDPEDFLRDTAATREAAPPVGAADEPAPATPDKRRGRENAALDGRSRAAKEAKRKAKAAAENVVKFRANKDSSS